jgi:hypothetical protein
MGHPPSQLAATLRAGTIVTSYIIRSEVCTRWYGQRRNRGPSWTWLSEPQDTVVSTFYLSDVLVRPTQPVGEVAVNIFPGATYLSLSFSLPPSHEGHAHLQLPSSLVHVSRFQKATSADSERPTRPGPKDGCLAGSPSAILR